MTQAWQQYRSAPAPGTRLVRLDDIAPGDTSSLTLQSERGSFPLLLVRLDDALFGYVNACPHQFLPLDQRGRRVLSQDGEQLRCTNHDATFSARSGEGTGGLGLGCTLDPVPVSVDDKGWIVVGTSP
ncbi:Rieske 2Fe-2S domain-containing protein [Halomonas sp. MCCC 1A17488]|uniref:Rieske 2Fe-2S domain-containing protein n=1 Tax=Billgrantia sulfidoxydans TaxID=2733484 RepID=A0ABX7W3R8_9GAMM|nr:MULTISPECIES: Rieske 2Fe-2S domain-containing protein [Halomonas]MCE8016016.1 Rieske 2Fe-2S domain-containing protein [Halomonas sp. MCCC 1A17488]MCG3239349.1 Rieske 2Fe-2S domain-containing protein [Halomonas sp. MCCC 1A17488]QPP50721.1 Rieske 2Fe-2S domain-containing protein [Halomonas sp. SS10-MC5]QTP54297.1 Rieske 2Fe-2S domain-containing protein [Halomonas sulfidoxydans]